MHDIAKEMYELADEVIVTAPEGRALLRKGAAEINRLRAMTETKPTSPVTSTRAGDEIIQADSSASEKVCDHPSAEKAAAWRVDGTQCGSPAVFFYWKDGDFLDAHREQGDKITPLYAAPPAGQVIANPANSLRSLPEPSLLGRETVREAQSIIRALAEQAKEKCDGCRLSWKLKDWRHREPLPITCEAKIERQAIRALASLSPLKE